MPKRLVLAVLVAATVTVPLAGASNASAEGCVTAWATGGHYGPSVERVVTIDQYGRVVVDPQPVTSYANYLLRDAAGLATCIV